MPAAFGGFTVTPSHDPAAPLFRFGVVADPQYAAAVPNLELNRYFSNSISKLAEAIDVFNREDLQFVVTLGDIIDGGWENFDAILSVYALSKHPTVFLPGNHDFNVAESHLPSVPTRLGLERAYYDFGGGGWRFVVIDGSEVSTFAPPRDDPRRALAVSRLETLKAQGAPNANTWNGSLGDAQFGWLEETLRTAERAGETVIVLGHYPVFPANDHNLWDSDRIVALLAGAPHVAAYLCGHNHAGNYGEAGGTHFVNFKGMVDTPAENTFAIVEVFAERIAVRGFGREEDRALGLRQR